jgi:H+/Cl- antiporter ClcA
LPPLLYYTPAGFTQTFYMVIISKVRKQLKHSFDSIHNERLKTNLLQALPFWVASLVTGVFAVLYAKLFAYAEEASHYIFHYKSWLFLALAPVCFVLARWLVVKYAPYARGSGIPQVIAAAELANPKYNHKVSKLLSLRIMVIKILSSMVMVIGGGVVGREGPTIQIAGSVFRKINEWLPAWWPKISKRNMINAGAAAGLAAAFNTPLGGIVFAVEELTKTHLSYFKTALFTAVIIAGLTAQSIMGPYLYLGYPDVAHVSPWVFPTIALLAVLTGIAGSAMSKLILALFKWKSTFRAKKQHIIYATVCGLGVAALAVFVSDKMLWSGKEIMTTTLFTADKKVEWYLPLLRMAGPIMSFTAGGAGGVFAPALSAGASIGSVIAGLFHFSDTSTNLLILCGMVGFLTGVTRTPFTSAILVLEMTDRHNVILHLMLAGLIANLASVIIDKHSFYDHLKHQYIHDLLKDEEQPAPAAEPEKGMPVAAAD